MANLRADNLTGTGGRESINGSVYFDGESSHLKVLTTSDLALGTGDFTIETWVYFTSTGTYQTIIDFRESNGLFPFLVRDTDGDIYYYVNGSVLINNIPAREDNTWHHVAVVRSSGTTKIYLNGKEEGSASDSTNYVATNDPYIGGSTSFSNALYGYLSNLRITKSALYTTNYFTPPTGKLKSIDNTVLLCCQDSENPTQEATGKEVIGIGACYYGKRYSNIATNGDLETGTTTGWTNGGCATFEVSNFSHSGSYSLHCVSDGNGDNVYYTLSLNTKYRYKISAYINCVGPLGSSAKAKMKIGTSNGGNQNYESQTANVGAGWQYVEWIGLPAASTLYVGFNESSANNVNDWYVDDLRVELWYPEEDQNILANPNFLTGATGWSFTSGNAQDGSGNPVNEWSISSDRLNVTDTNRTNDAFATQQLFYNNVKEGRYRITADYAFATGGFDAGIGGNRIWTIQGTSSNTWELEGGSGNSSFRLIVGQTGAGYFNNVHLYRIAEPKRTNNPIPPVGVDEGVTFEGDTKVNTQSYMYFPTGNTAHRGRGRGVFMANAVSPTMSNSISYIDIQSSGNTVDFGDLTVTTRYGAGGSSATRGLSGGGVTPSWPANNAIDYFTLATTGNAKEFGDMYKTGSYGHACVGNSTRLLWCGGYSVPDSGNTNTVSYSTIATLGDALNFGDLSDGSSLLRRYISGGIQSPTRGILMGGYSGSAYTNSIVYISITTLGDSEDFGDLSYTAAGTPGASSSTRGIIFPGYNGSNYNTNSIEYVTIASTGNAADFGDTTHSGGYGQAVSNSSRAVMGHGLTPSPGTNYMEFVTIATTGNASDFGDMEAHTGDSGNNNNCSDSHGGL